MAAGGGIEVDLQAPQVHHQGGLPVTDGFVEDIAQGVSGVGGNHQHPLFLPGGQQR